MRRRMGRPGLVGTMARTAVVAGTASAVVGHSQNKQATKQQAAADAQMQDQQMAEMQAQMNAMQAQQAQQAAPPPPAPRLLQRRPLLQPPLPQQAAT